LKTILLSQMYKLFTRIITNRLTNKVDSYQPRENVVERKNSRKERGRNNIFRKLTERLVKIDDKPIKLKYSSPSVS